MEPNTAEKMNEIATKMRQEAEKKQLEQYEELIVKIDAAASKGLYNIKVDTINVPTKKKLESNGFKVEYYFGSQYRGDQSHYTISW